MRFTPGNARAIGSRQEQQDAFGFSDPARSAFLAHAGFLVVIADGMGGMSYGAVAASGAVRSFLAAYHAKPPREPVAATLARSLQQANEAIETLARELQCEGELGSTLAAAVLHRDGLYWIAVGDSRIYVCRGKRLIRLTEDHTRGADLDDEVADGRLDPEAARTDPGRHRLSSYLGLPALPHIDWNRRAFPLQPGDSILLCSDGLYRVLTEEEIVAAIGGNAQQICDSLVESALAKGHANQDNTTVAMIQLVSGERRWAPWMTTAIAACLLLVGAVLALRLWMPHRSAIQPRPTAASAADTAAMPASPASLPVPKKGPSGRPRPKRVPAPPDRPILAPPPQPQPEAPPPPERK
jgi:protein phosphatase